MPLIIKTSYINSNAILISNQWNFFKYLIDGTGLENNLN